MRWRELERTYCITSISARNTGTWAFFRTPFSTTFRWRIFLKPTGIDQSVTQEPISVKNSKSTNSPNFSWRVAHGRSRSLACREHHLRRLRKRNKVHHCIRTSAMTRCINWAGLFSFALFLSFSSFSFLHFFVLERDCLLCAICDT